MKSLIAAPIKFALLSCVVVFGNAATHAQIVEAKWADGAFAHKATIAPKKFLEVCGKLKLGEAVAWHFGSAAPTDFNIHYHVGKDAVYPENRKETTSAAGTLVAPADQHYCWMWNNRTPNPLEIDVDLKPLRAGQ